MPFELAGHAMQRRDLALRDFIGAPLRLESHRAQTPLIAHGDRWKKLSIKNSRR
jgi:hypothetical protein